MNIRVDYIQYSRRKGTAVVSTGQFWVFLNTHSSNRRHLNVRALWEQGPGQSTVEGKREKSLENVQKHKTIKKKKTKKHGVQRMHL